MTSQICLLRRSVLCLFTIAGGSYAVDGAEAIRPNIVMVVSDDQGYGDASCYWNTGKGGLDRRISNTERQNIEGQLASQRDIPRSIFCGSSLPEMIGERLPETG